MNKEKKKQYLHKCERCETQWDAPVKDCPVCCEDKECVREQGHTGFHWSKEDVESNKTEKNMTIQNLLSSEKEEFIEKGAELGHIRWANWQKYCHSKMKHLSCSPAYMSLPIEDFERWERQIATPYAELSEQEKESDRREVRTYLPWLTSHDHRILEAMAKEVLGIIARRKKYTNWSHTRGSHADDPKDVEPCDCMEKEIAIKNQVFDEVSAEISTLTPFISK
jgi:hypothetical protein